MKWKCSQCRLEVECSTTPSTRFEATSSVFVGKNTYQGITNKDATKDANHHEPVCFGPERGEDYYQHNWKKGESK